VFRYVFTLHYILYIHHKEKYCKIKGVDNNEITLFLIQCQFMKTCKEDG